MEETSQIMSTDAESIETEMEELLKLPLFADDHPCGKSQRTDNKGANKQLQQGCRIQRCPTRVGYYIPAMNNGV